jgi:hypothetical protein
MPRLSEIRSSILDQITGHLPTDDTRFDLEFIENLVREKRSLLIHDRAKTGLGVESAYYQDLSCLTITQEKLLCGGEDAGGVHACITVPSIERFRGAIAYLGRTSGDRPFGELGLSAFLRNAPDRFCRHTPVFTVLPGKIYLKNVDPGMETVRMIAVLEDPRADTCILDFEEAPYPVPAHALHQLELLCLKQMMSTLPIRPDRVNDGQDGQTLAGQLNTKNLD